MRPSIALLVGLCAASKGSKSVNDLTKGVVRISLSGSPVLPVVSAVGNIFAWNKTLPKLINDERVRTARSVDKHKKMLYELEGEVVKLFASVKAHYDSIIRCINHKMHNGDAPSPLCSRAAISKLTEQQAAIDDKRKTLLPLLIAARKQTEIQLQSDSEAYVQRITAGVQMARSAAPGHEDLAERVCLLIEAELARTELNSVDKYIAPNESPTTFILRGDGSLFERFLAVAIDKDALEALNLEYARALGMLALKQNLLSSIGCTEQQSAYTRSRLVMRRDFASKAAEEFAKAHPQLIEDDVQNTFKAVMQAIMVLTPSGRSKIAAAKSRIEVAVAKAPKPVPKWQADQQRDVVAALEAEAKVKSAAVQERTFDAVGLDTAAAGVIEHYKGAYDRIVSPAPSDSSKHHESDSVCAVWKDVAVVSEISSEPFMTEAYAAAFAETLDVVRGAESLYKTIDSTRTAVAVATTDFSDCQAEYGALMMKHNSTIGRIAEADSTLQALLTQLENFAPQRGHTANAKLTSKANRAVQSFQATLPLLGDLLSTDAALCATAHDVARKASKAAARLHALKHALAILEHFIEH